MKKSLCSGIGSILIRTGIIMTIINVVNPDYQLFLGRASIKYFWDETILAELLTKFQWTINSMTIAVSCDYTQTNLFQ